MNMNDNSTMEDAVRLTLSKLLALSHEELQSRLEKHQNSEFATLFRTIREYDQEFPRNSSLPTAASQVLPEEFLQQLEQWITQRIEQQLEKSLVHVLPKLLTVTLSKQLTLVQALPQS